MRTRAKDFWDQVRDHLPVHLRTPYGRYVSSVLLLAIGGAASAALISPSGPGRLMSAVFAALVLLLLLAFARGWSEHKTVYGAASLGLTYLFGVSLTEGHLYSSTLAWLPLVPLAIFYVIHPRAGRLWLLVVAGVQVLMAWVAWVWGAQLPVLEGPQLPLMSLIDLELASVALFLVPYFYQRDLDRHLLEHQTRQRVLQAKQVELEYTQQLQEQFMASVSHELRTPMNAILGLNTVLLERVHDKPRALKVLQYTRQSADHLMTVINDVLDYSQMHLGNIVPRLERFALHETVQAAFEMFQPRIENTRVRYECRIAPDVPQWVCADRHRLMQVLVNLLGNAIKFTHQGVICLQVRVVAEGIEFEVQDTGIGIAPEQQKKIFEWFSQANASIQGRYGGSGLGLTISQRLVRMLGGRLQLESHEGAGSRFWFCLPLQAEAPPQAAQPSHSARKVHAQQAWRFLVVDDHPVNRLLVHQILTRFWPQAEVVEAENGQQALVQLQSQPFDLVLMDMVMPVMDGIEATAALRASAHARLRQTPVLGLTANVNTGDLTRFQRAGLDGLLLKPFDIEALLAQVERMLTGSEQGPSAAPQLTR